MILSDAKSQTSRTNKTESAWAWSKEHRSACLVIDSESLWGQTLFRVWLPIQDAVVRIRTDQLLSLDNVPSDKAADHLAYIAAAARIADALTQDILLAPIESSVIPLPHQIRALSRAMTGDRVRYLLADEVGNDKDLLFQPVRPMT